MITINETILSGNMGSGWTDQNAAAAAYAAHLESVYRTEAEARFPGHEIEIRVLSKDNTSGWCADADVYSDDPDMDLTALRDAIRDQRHWERWCESDQAAQYATDD